MQEILSNKHNRKVFYSFSAAIFALLALFRYVVVTYCMSGKLASASAHLADGLITSLFTTILIGSFLFYVTPPVMRTVKIEPIDPNTINELLKAAATTSLTWTLRGGMGRYTRSETLPTMIKRARESGGRRKIRLVILDPDNTQACRGYAKYRNGVASASKQAQQYTEATVRINLLATILAAVNASLTESMIDVEVYLSSMWPVVRIDLSDSYAILTTENPQEPGLRIDQGSHFYKTYARELDFIAQQSRPLPEFDSSSGLNLVSPNDVRAMLERLGIACVDITQAQCEEIFQLINSKNHQYV